MHGSFKSPFPPLGEEGPLFPFGGREKGSSPRREGTMATRRAWLAWPWASQASARPHRLVATSFVTRLPFEPAASHAQ